MNYPEFDGDGYPTEATLAHVATWDGDFRKLMEFVAHAWRYPYYISRNRNGKWFVSTGGWSGNESLICALRDNHVVWSLHWYSSRRGGHYVFEEKL